MRSLAGRRRQRGDPVAAQVWQAAAGGGRGGGARCARRSTTSSRVAASRPTTSRPCRRSTHRPRPTRRWQRRNSRLEDKRIAALPLAPIDAGRELPLRAGVNPAWAQALAMLQQKAIVPLLGGPADADRRTRVARAAAPRRVLPRLAGGQAGVAAFGAGRLRARRPAGNQGRGDGAHRRGREGRAAQRAAARPGEAAAPQARPAAAARELRLVQGLLPPRRARSSRPARSTSTAAAAISRCRWTTSSSTRCWRAWRRPAWPTANAGAAARR